MVKKLKVKKYENVDTKVCICWMVETDVVLAAQWMDGWMGE